MADHPVEMPQRETKAIAYSAAAIYGGAATIGLVEGTIPGGTIFIVAWIGAVHGVALAAMPDGMGNLDRWIDVTGSVLVVAAVVRGLSARSDELVERLKTEARLDPLTGLMPGAGAGAAKRAGRNRTAVHAR